MLLPHMVSVDPALPPPQFLILREGPVEVKAESQLLAQAAQLLVWDLSTPPQVLPLHEQDEGDTTWSSGSGPHTPSHIVMLDMLLVSPGHSRGAHMEEQLREMV